MPLIARQRSRLAVLAVLALVGSLLAVSAMPAAGVDGKADNPADFSACVGAATESAGFDDVSDSTKTGEAVNCLYHYNITRGSGTPGMYNPGGTVTRLQMARFLVRAAGPAGIEVGDAEDQDFTDIGDASDIAQDAINQAAALGFIKGTSDTTFSPGGVVTRADMAVFLDGFLTAYDADNGKIEPDDEVFTDIDSVPFAGIRGDPPDLRARCGAGYDRHDLLSRYAG